MTTPIWMGAPPELHSALLSSGPGPGLLLAAAAAWNALSSEYAKAADELAALVGAVGSGVWEGPAAASYATANAPYVAWLAQASTDAAATAAVHETAAAAYTGALAAMPTLGELAANHATHAVLVGTNFFGINTIPIALNEADYLRMWIQAATTMSTYQGVSTAAVSASPPPTPAPAIVKSDATAGPGASADPLQTLFDFLAQVEKVFNTVGGESGGDLFSYIFSVPPGTDPLTWFVSKVNVLSSPTSGYPALLQGLVNAAGNNPILLAAAYLFGGAAIVYDLTIQAVQFLVTFPLLAVPLAAPVLALPAGFAGGVIGVAEIHAHLPTGLEPSPTTPVTPAVSPAPGSVSGSAAPAPAPAPAASALAPSPSAPAPALSAPAPPGTAPPPGSTAGPFPYLAGGAIRMDAQTSARTRLRKKLPTPDSAEAPAAAAAAAREQARKRRQRRSKVEERGRGYEFMDLDDAGGYDAGDGGREYAGATAADGGAGTLGFAGAARREAVAQPAGLTALAEDAFGSGPNEPMLPSSWAPVESDESRERR